MRRYSGRRFPPHPGGSAKGKRCGPRSRVVLVAMVTVAGFAVLAPAAGAAITPTTNASTISAAITTNAAFVTGASFPAYPPGPPQVANATADSALAGFPRHGPTYGILSTGDAQLADDVDASAGVDANGAPIRGDTADDVTILRIDLQVPADRNCLAIDFRFLSEEFPDFVGGAFNDAFIAELESSTWTTSGSEINAPNNFAFDPQGNVISINATGPATMSAGEAAGTAYGGATPLLQARTPITSGAHPLFLSIFDQGDADLDSATFLDALNFLNVPATSCQPGVVSANPPPSSPPPAQSGTPLVTLPPPVANQTANARPVEGTILVDRHDGRGFTPLLAGEQIPIGSTIDARAGKVEIISSDGKGGTRAGTFFGGVFNLLQPSGGAITEIKLTGKLAGCGKGAKKTAAAASGPRARSAGRRGRLTWGSGGGGHRSTGRRGAATVRGTTWLVQDRCDGSTLTKVTDGVVRFRDFVLDKTVTVRQGQRYIARPGRD